MPADSVRERLISAVCTRLEGIATDPEFHYQYKLRGVERYIHILDPELNEADDDRQINSGDDLTILVIPEDETDTFSGSEVPDSSVLVSLTLTISFRLGATATCTEYNRALQDIKHALFRNWDHLGDTVGAELENAVNFRQIPDAFVQNESANYYDAVVYRVTFSYMENLGDPANQE